MRGSKGANPYETEFLQSLEAARRIQEELLPTDEFISNLLPDSFVLNLPRDIVSGDFYWVEQVNDIVLFAVADSTGHGVPGAIIREMCQNSLNSSLKEYGMVVPGHILDKTRDILVRRIEEKGGNLSEGMDIALCSLENKKLQYAGANNPLWIVRSKVLIEENASRQAIGKNTRPAPFITKTIELEKGDTLYIFSDGYKDQFGGEQNKKFKQSQLKDLLISINDKSMQEQREILEARFRVWKGDHDQTDDVCMMGVRI